MGMHHKRGRKNISIIEVFLKVLANCPPNGLLKLLMEINDRATHNVE